MKKMSTKMKALNIFLLILIVIGIYMLFTQDKWVPKLTNYILSFDESKRNIGSRWTGPISAVKMDCIFDGICSVTVSGVEVIVSNGMVPIQQEIGFGSLKGVESIGDFQSYIGKNANVYAKRITNEVFTLSGSNEFYIEVVK